MFSVTSPMFSITSSIKLASLLICLCMAQTLSSFSLIKLAWLCLCLVHTFSFFSPIKAHFAWFACGSSFPPIKLALLWFVQSSHPLLYTLLDKICFCTASSSFSIVRCTRLVFSSYCLFSNVVMIKYVHASSPFQQPGDVCAWSMWWISNQFLVGLTVFCGHILYYRRGSFVR